MKHTMIWDEKGDTRGSDIHNTSEAERGTGAGGGGRGGKRERMEDRQREGRKTRIDRQMVRRRVRPRDIERET